MKNIEKFISYCESKPFTSFDTPFGPDVLVFRVHGKIFALTGLDEVEFKVNLKCDPEYAIDLREKHIEVQPGYHMSKKHWNTVKFDGNLSDKLLKDLVDHSYQLVYESLPKKLKEHK
ncbi:MAG: MmcQ/YjbR family DNA-binding protein [Saprospiraceae bacterium]|nr:MmcQ/YjbR family DNA-binding protein [Saprospiraceae bacterium]